MNGEHTMAKRYGFEDAVEVATDHLSEKEIKKAQRAEFGALMNNQSNFLPRYSAEKAIEIAKKYHLGDRAVFAAQKKFESAA